MRHNLCLFPSKVVGHKTNNGGNFLDLAEPMQLRNVKKVAKKGGIGLQGVKIKIIRDINLQGKGLYGYAHHNGKLIHLYPDAFTDTETLIRTLGHERTHLFQFKIYGQPKSSQSGALLENAAYQIEDSFVEFWKKSGYLKF